MGELARVLCLDDEPQVLEGLKLNLRKHFALTTTDKGASALQLLRTEGPFAAIVSDMRMPIMDGATFLSEARTICPDTVRILLTGQADLQSAVAAVNNGQIFRFLIKPCPAPTLVNVLNEAVRQHSLVTAEKELLAKTLRGAVDALTDVLSVVQPNVFGRATRIKRIVGLMASELGVQEPWAVEVAAMLYSIGFVSLPPRTAEKILHGDPLDAEEKLMVKRVPAVTRQILGNIPRLEPVIQILDEAAKLEGGATGSASLPARVLRIGLDYDNLDTSGRSRQLILAALAPRRGTYGDQVVSALEASLRKLENEPSKVQSVLLAEVRAGMILMDDLQTTGGMLLASRGHEITAGFLSRVNNFARSAGVREPILVKIRS